MNPQFLKSSLQSGDSVANIPKGVLGTRVNPDMCRMSVGYV